jgi:protein O-mannosyl-transferase
LKTDQNIKYAIAVFVALVTLLVYLPSLRNGFVGVWDDNINIVENPHIRSLDIPFFRWAFFDFHGSNWLPLTWISLAVDHALWALDPLGYHLTNILLHMVNTLLVVLLIVKLLQTVKKGRTGSDITGFHDDRPIMIAAGVTGLLFGIHPLHVESVAWAAERKDLLCALFFLMSVLTYTNYAGDKEQGNEGQVAEVNREDVLGRKRGLTNKNYIATLGFFVLALMSKPMAVTLPVVLLILDWYPFKRIVSLRSFLAATIEKTPYLVLSIASSIITVLAQRSGESIASLDIVPLSSRLLVAAHSLIAYLGKMLLPLNLVPFYPYPKEASLFSFQYLSALVVVIGITTAAVSAAKQKQVWFATWGYYVVTLMPVLGIIQVGNQAMADRYTYLPSLGPFLIAGLCTAWIAGKKNATSKRNIPLSFAAAGVVIIVFLVLSSRTIQQIGVWKNGFILWDNVIVKGFESAAAYNNRGLSLDEIGQRDRAKADFEQAIALDPRNYFAYNNMGMVYGKDGQYQKSIEYFLKAIAINPYHADSYCNLGLSYFYLKQYDKALENYNNAIRLKRDFDMAYLDRGNLYLTMGDRGLAAADYRRSCSLGNVKACEILQLVSGNR